LSPSHGWWRLTVSAPSRTVDRLGLPVASRTPWHASPRRGASPRCDEATGEIRIPLALFAIDQHQGDVDLVLSRLEGEALLESVRSALTPSVEGALLPGGRG
jgi:hypothetical protein